MKKKVIKLAELQKTDAILSPSKAISIRGGKDDGTTSGFIITDSCSGDLISNTGDWNDEGCDG